MNKILKTILALSLTALLSASCVTNDMPIAEPLKINSELEGLVNLIIHSAEGSGGHWILSVALENDTGQMLTSGLIPDKLEYFDGQHWRSVPMIAAVPSLGLAFHPRGGYATIFSMDETDAGGNQLRVSSGTWPNEEEHAKIMQNATPWDLGIGYVFERDGKRYRFMSWASPEQAIESWQHTVTLHPQSFGFDGIDGEGLIEFWPGLFRLRHRVWPNSVIGDFDRVRAASHEVVAEFLVP